MSNSRPESNIQDLERELGWLALWIDRRFRIYFAEVNGGDDAETEELVSEATLPEPSPPELDSSDSPYARLITEHAFGTDERLALVLALVPHVRPKLLDIFFVRNRTYDRRFTEFGGIYQDLSHGFQPTGETLAFFLGGDDLATRFSVQQLFGPDHVFARHHLLRLEARDQGSQPVLTGRLVMSPDLVSRLTTGDPYHPDFGADFPARRIETRLGWDDLVLHPGTRRQIGEIEDFIAHGDTLMNDWGMAAKLRPGHRSLFHGPPGTGKTMTACLLGKATGRDVYRVDLSMIISKYIGETEKNLAKIFDQAEHRDWILFFDEADALFGKRSEVKDSHARYANQEVSFLLQRIELFDGVVILASNLRDNLDPAFTRRFESILYFPMPDAEQRLQLWRQGFSPEATLGPALDLETIAKEHTLSGGSIINIIRYVSLAAIATGNVGIDQDRLLRGIHREYAKEGQAL